MRCIFVPTNKQKKRKDMTFTFEECGDFTETHYRFEADGCYEDGYQVDPATIEVEVILGGQGSYFNFDDLSDVARAKALSCTASFINDNYDFWDDVSMSEEDNY